MKTLSSENNSSLYICRYKPIWYLLVVVIMQISPHIGTAQTKQYTYSEIISLAFEHQPLLKANQRNIDAAALQQELFQKEYLPQMFFDVNISRWKYLLPNKQKLLGNSLNDIYADVRINQLLYDWDKNSIQQQSAERAVDIDRNTGRKLRQTISYSIAKAYLELMKATRSVRIQEEAILQLEEHLKNAEALYTIGKVSNLDVLKAQVQIEIARDELAKSQNQIRLQKNIINTYSGNVLGNDFDVVDVIDEWWRSSSTKTFRADEITSGLTSQHPDLANSTIQQDLRNKEIELLKTDYYPSLYAFGITNVEDSRLPMGNFNWNVGVTVSYSLPFFRGSVMEEKIQQTTVRMDALKETQNAIRQQLEVTVKNNLLKMDDLKSRLLSSEKIVTLANESLIASTMKYNIGKGNSLDVLDAETVLTTAKLQYNQIIIDLLTIIAELNYTIGSDALPFTE